jgi:hypothetical protein
MGAASIITVLLLLTAQYADAQEVEVRVDPGPHYVGVPIGIQVVARGFEEEPQPKPEIPPPQDGRLELMGVSPNISSQITIINGRMSRTKQTTFVYRYRFLASRPGRLELGPFRITQGATVRSTRKLSLNLAQIPLSDRIRVELEVPESPMYVGGRTPITFRWWLESQLAESLHDYTLRVPFFDTTDSFQFIDQEVQKGQQELKIETSAGTLRLHGNTETRRLGGRAYLVISVTRTFVALKPGSYDLAPATSVVEEGIRWQRDFFGGRSATRVRKLRAKDRERHLEVRALPQEGQPESFAGAIGKGFSLEVTADRTVVKVGDPIRLTLTLRGEGNLASAGLGALSADGGLSSRQFRLPTDDATGVVEDGGKTFTRVVRVTDPSVSEIPSIAYSFFDPEAGAYRTVRSRPIALSVGAAQVVDATDVVTATDHDEPMPTGPAPGDAVQATDSAAPTPRIRLTGADLAIETDVATLLRDGTQVLGGPWLWCGLHAFGLLIVLLALWERRRASVDPALVRRRKLLQEERKKILLATSRGDLEAITEVAGCLRRMLTEVPSARNSELDAFLAECDAITYAPSAELKKSRLRPGFEERAKSLSQVILGSLE